MYLETKNKVVINDDLIGNKSVILQLRIFRVVYTPNMQLEVQFQYFQKDEEGIGYTPADIRGIRNPYYNLEQNDTFYEQIKAMIPTEVGDMTHQWYKFYIAAKVMMHTFLLPQNPDLKLGNIEIIAENAKS